MKELIKTSGNWYKGNFHMHTTLSDGQQTPLEAIETYRKNGYDFIALTDHRKPNTTIEPHQKGFVGEYEVDAKEMLILSGVEWDTGGANTNLEGDVPTFHILGIGMDLPQEPEFASIHHPKPQAIVDEINKHNGIAILAHPCWSVMDPSSIQEVQGLTAAEIFNTVSGLPWNGDRSESSTWFDIWATHYQIYMTAVSGDDTHHYSGDECQSFNMINAKSLSRNDILEAVKEGNCYCSQGPIIHQIGLDEEKNEIVISCSEDVQTAVFYSNHIWRKDRVKHVEEGKVTYPIMKGDTYVRVELITIDGKKAWTSPFEVK